MLTADADRPLKDLGEELASIRHLKGEVMKLLWGKETVVDTALCTIISSGHLLIEDVPGVGKTTFIKGLAKLLGLNVSRVQCTSDLLPADIVGVEVYNSSTNTFDFHRGPIFANILIADELNRASPRTQSALLEAMGEGRVTVDRTTHKLPEPFAVFASQNPTSSIGTYDIPESQLDRFSAKVKIGYPGEDGEFEILRSAVADPLVSLPSDVLSIEQIQGLRNKVEQVYLSDEVVSYAKRFIDETRNNSGLKLGVSTRGGVIWLRMTKALALINGRDYVIPDDLQNLAEGCLAHRLICVSGVDAAEIVHELLSKVAI